MSLFDVAFHTFKTHTTYKLYFSAQSNNEQQHNRTNTTIAALTATTASSFVKANSNQREASAAEFEGNNVEYRAPENQGECSINQAQPGGDMELGVALERRGQHTVENIVASGLT